MSRPITVDLDALPAAISESVRAVLAAHGFVVAVPGSDFDPGAVELGAARFAELLVEIGRNTAQIVATCEVE